ncbi:MAG: hypothetical protein OHK005_11530 [Candidatus Methylacidiphilales bacterium]
MRIDRRIQLGVATFATAIFCLGELALLRPPSYEFFPFYSWSMFALVPGKREIFYVLVETPHGKVDFKQGGAGIRNQHSVVAYNLIQKLGRAAAAGDAAEVAAWRGQFEKSHLEAGTRYRVVMWREDAMARWRVERRGSGLPDDLPVVWQGEAEP